MLIVCVNVHVYLIPQGVVIARKHTWIMLWVVFFAKRSHMWGSVEKEEEEPEEGIHPMASILDWNTIGVVMSHVTLVTGVNPISEKYILVFSCSNLRNFHSQ